MLFPQLLLPESTLKIAVFTPSLSDKSLYLRFVIASGLRSKVKAMNSKKQLLAQYVLNGTWFNNVLTGFADEETNRRISPDMNHVKYLAGHLFTSLYSFAMIAEIQVEKKWGELFAGVGKSKALDHYEYPSIEEIRAEWARVFPLVKRGLEALPEEGLQKEFPASPVAGFGILDATIGDLWAFLNLHQAYHIGQIGILRRGFGKDPMKYF